jgi:predicted nuclease with TOPRIM domain
MEKVLKEEQVAIGKLDQSTRDLLEKAQRVITCTRL